MIPVSLLRTTPLVAILCAATLYAQTPGPETVTAPGAAAEIAHPAAPETTAAPAEHESSIRIVRLSQAKGEVRLDRGIGHGLETAFTNLPITQGAQLSTTAAGVAEVEFEDNSSLRLTPGSLVEFPHLGLRQTGVKATTVRVLKGTVYFSLSNSKANDFTVLFAKDHFTLPPSSHVALSVADPGTRLVVFDGTVQVETPSSAVMTVTKKKSLLFDPADQALPTLAGNHEASSFDQWDKNSASYHASIANVASFGGGSSLYGLNDLNHYGSFVDGGAGCGSVWRPYFANAGFDPFANGVWAQYPGAGYTFVSPYPWGWTPFHSGSWSFCGNGWGWQPGGNSYGLNNTGVIAFNNRAGTPIHPRPPAPGPHAPSMVVVSTQPLAVSRFNAEGLVIHQNSAGLGVPREGVGRLGKLSTGVAQHGSVTANIAAPAAPGFSGLPQTSRGPAVGPAQNASVHSATTYNSPAANPGMGRGPVGSGQSPGLGAGHAASGSPSSGGGHGR